MNELAEKVASLLGVSADKIATVYPDMVRAWAFDAWLAIGVGGIFLGVAAWAAVAANQAARSDTIDGELWVVLGGLGAAICMVVGLVCIASSLSSVIWPEATFVSHLMGQLKK